MLALHQKVLSKALEETEDPLEPVRAIRQLRHEQLGKQLFLAQKNASLRSGSRGLQARKELKSLENKVTASEELFVLLSLCIDAQFCSATNSL